MSSFFEQLPSRIAAWRACWSAFCRRWRTLAADGLLPELDLPAPPSNKTPRYAVRESDLPIALQEELIGIKVRLVGGLIDDRGGVSPLDESTRELVLATVMRLLGFLISRRRTTCEAMTIADALQLESARALVNYTSARYYESIGVPPELDEAGRVIVGEYQVGILRQLAAVVRLGLRDARLHAEYAEEIRFVSVGVRNRRESSKVPGHVDDYYRVALKLAERAVESTTNGNMTATTATMVRDALILALLAAHGYRRSILAGLEVNKSVRQASDGTVTLCVPREDTKPGIRDLQLELPQEMIGLWRLYTQTARPVLLCGKRADTLLIAQGGKSLSNAAIYAIVVSRSEEILGVRHNPHQARKAIATDHGLWSGGDYLSIAAVLDSSPLMLQKHYVDLQREHRIGQFDEATNAAWLLARKGRAA